jgi:hypothetical protein
MYAGPDALQDIGHETNFETENNSKNTSIEEDGERGERVITHKIFIYSG